MNAPMTLEPAKISDFRLAGTLGAGTAPRVYGAVHLATGRPVVIKMMQPQRSSSEARERFAREARILSGIQSQHVGQVLGFGYDEDQPFLVLEQLDGETLDAKLRRDGPVRLSIAMHWIEQLIVGLRDCHDATIVHRDIKPSNVFLHRRPTSGTRRDDEVVKLIDFGIARLREGSDDDGGVTAPDPLIGSAGYMAPEQFGNANSVGCTADLYALGVVVFRMLTGRLPFFSRSLDALIQMKNEQPVPQVSSVPGIQRNSLLDEFVQKAMAREPTDRFRSAREMLEQWWTVMASLAEGEDEDDDAATGILRDVRRVATSQAESPRAEPPREEVDAPPESSRSATHPADLEEQTVRRPPPVSLTSEMTFRDEPSFTTAEAEFRRANETEREHRADFDDLPTQNHPDLKKLVERELELERERIERE